MAYYKNPQHLTLSNEPAFDLTHHPGSLAPFSGVYRCTGCGKSVTSIKGRHLPSQFGGFHAHHPGPILWQLIVMSHMVGGG